jgi:hypothetical protein
LCALGAQHLDNDKTLLAALKREREASAKAAAARKAWRARHAALKERESLGKADAAGAPATVAMAGAADRLPPEEAKLRTKEAKLHRRQIVVDKKRATERDASEGAPFVGGDAVVRRHIDDGLDGLRAVRAGTPGLVLCVLDDGDIEVLFEPAGRPKEVYTVDADVGNDSFISNATGNEILSAAAVRRPSTTMLNKSSYSQATLR